MQPNVSLIKKLMMHIDFLGKNLYPVGQAKLSSTSVVILTLDIKTLKVVWSQKSSVLCILYFSMTTLVELSLAHPTE